MNLTRFSIGLSACAALGPLWLVVACDQSSTTPSSGTAKAPALAQTPSEQGAPKSVADQELRAELRPIFAEIAQRRTGPARVKLRKHVTAHPTDGQAHFLFGLTYHREKKYAEAREWFEKALRLEPAYAVTRYFLGWTLYYLGEPSQARASFEMFLQARPGEYDSTFALGLIALDEDDLPEAERLFNESIRLLRESNSDDQAAMSRGLARLGEVQERQGKLAEARSELEEAVRLYPDHYEALYKLYRVLVRLDEKEEAQKVHEQYIATRERVRPGTSFPE